MSVQILKSDEARNNWRDVLDTVSAGDDVVIERYTKAVAALIRYEDYVALQDELEDLRASERAATAYAAWKDDPTRARPYTEIRAELLAEGKIDGDL